MLFQIVNTQGGEKPAKGEKPKNWYFMEGQELCLLVRKNFKSGGEKKKERNVAS